MFQLVTVTPTKLSFVIQSLAPTVNVKKPYVKS